MVADGVLAADIVANGVLPSDAVDDGVLPADVVAYGVLTNMLTQMMSYLLMLSLTVTY